MSSRRRAFIVEFDSTVWASLSEAEQEQWVDDVTDAINGTASVVAVGVMPEQHVGDGR